jgi:DNA-binding NtrC family response regulator
VSVSDLSGLRLLVVDDENDIRMGLRLLLEPLGCDVDVAESGREALSILEDRGADLVLSDLQMPGMSGTELLAEIKTRSPGTVVAILTGFGTIQAAVWCLQNGASHFLTKPFDNDEIRGLVARLGRQILGRRAPPGGSDDVIVGDHPRMRAVLELVERVAQAPVPVLIEGETGTGKELVARAVHRRSGPGERPFLAVNAAALPDTLLESELFGHERGAFTGAESARRGLFEQARGGTVFLDEIASMSLAFQGKLLRVLEDKLVRPLGGSRDVPVDFRLVSATNRDLEALIASGAFRDDLFYRLRVVSIRIPPLRERRSDVLPLAQHFLAEATRRCLGPSAACPELTPSAADALLGHEWPGNVRELENAVQRAVVVCAGDRVLPHHLGLGTASWEVPELEQADYETGKREAVERFQREFVERALAGTEGNVTRAADRCGLTRAAFQRILRQLGVDRTAFERA